MEIRIAKTIADEDAIKALAEASGVRSLSLDTSLNYCDGLPPFYFLYEGSRLVSFLTLFFPTNHDVEVTAFTHPLWRERGCFDILCKEACRQSVGFGFSRMLFAINRASLSGKAVVAHYPAPYAFSEYVMRFCPDVEMPSIDPAFHLEEATPELFLDAFAEVLCKGKNRNTYILYKGEEAVGHVALSLENEDLWIYHVGIKPSLRGLGYGTALMVKAIEKASPSLPILEVDTGNKIALHLYEKLGFKIIDGMDYYAMEILKD